MTNGGIITFGDPLLKEREISKLGGLLVLQNILFVNGLKANLLSISQFCDDNFSEQLLGD